MEESVNVDQARALHQCLCTAMVEADSLQIGKLLDESASLTHMSGYVQSKTEWLGEFETGSMGYHHIRSIDERIEHGEYVVKTFVTQ